MKTLPVHEIKLEKPSHKHIETIAKLSRLARNKSCDFSVVGILLWAEYFNYEIAIYQDNLFLIGKIPGRNEILCYPPMGTLQYDVALDVLCILTEGKDAFIIEYDEVPASEFSEEQSNEQGVIRDWMEYLYDIHKIATMAGKKMEKKRNHLNYFRNHYADAEIFPISITDIEELKEFTRKFASEHQDAEIALYESRNIISILSNYEAFGMMGICVRYEGRVIGYAIGEIVGDTLHAHIEKGDVDFRGIYQVLASELCRRALEIDNGLKYVNREDDMGSLHLRQSKMSYHPDLLIQKRIVALSSNSEQMVQNAVTTDLVNA